MLLQHKHHYYLIQMQYEGIAEMFDNRFLQRNISISYEFFNLVMKKIRKKGNNSDFFPKIFSKNRNNSDFFPKRNSKNQNNSEFFPNRNSKNRNISDFFPKIIWIVSYICFRELKSIENNKKILPTSKNDTDQIRTDAEQVHGISSSTPLNSSATVPFYFKCIFDFHKSVTIYHQIFIDDTIKNQEMIILRNFHLNDRNYCYLTKSESITTEIKFEFKS